MMHPKSPAIEEVFFAALEHESPEARAAYLEEACGSDAERVRPVNHVFQADRGHGMMFGAPS